MNDDTELVLDWLKSTDIALSTIARKSGISRKSLHNWKLGGLPSGQSLKKLTKYYNNIQVNKITSDKTGHIDKDYVIGLQQDKIKTLEVINEKADMERNIWEMLEYNATTTVNIKFDNFKLCRKIASVTGLELMSEALGYTVKELHDDLFCVGKWYKMRDHPIDTILSKETKDSLKHYTDNFPALFQSMKSIVGDHYIPFNVVYLAKDRSVSVQASVYNKIFWRDMKIESKVKMFV